MLPKEMIKEFIGKVCSITVFDSSIGYVSRILEAEDNWLKIKNGDGIQMINGDMIKNISIMPDKYQNKYQ